MMVDELYKILRSVQTLAGHRFSGVGLLVCDSPENLPIYTIGVFEQSRYRQSLSEVLATVSVPENDCHDGFHIVSSGGEILRVSQYFSPPVLKDYEVDRSKRFGARYLAALFGSALPEVAASGIASNDFGAAVFVRGSEVLYRGVS